ncbi:MAG: hypothetical protein IVW51_08950 [Thermaceae bacterium]|nr:hypothetical protein [Thermaceae bacterium]
MNPYELKSKLAVLLSRLAEQILFNRALLRSGIPLDTLEANLKAEATNPDTINEISLLTEVPPHGVLQALLREVGRAKPGSADKLN